MKKVAVIGCGHIAKRHVANLGKVGTLAAVCDLVPERARAIAAGCSATVYTSIDELLLEEKDVELVVVCTPNGLHAEHIIKSLQAGKDVLTEKPLCLTKAAAWQIIETEKYCRRKLFLVQSAVYNPIVTALQVALAESQLGRVYSFHLNCIWNRPDSYFTDWRGKNFPDGGLLYNQFSHYLDVLLLLFGDVDSVKGFTANLGHRNSVEFEDTGAASLQMRCGALGTLHWSVNAYQKNHEIGLTIVAEKGTVKIGGEYLNEVQAVQTATDLGLQSFEKASVDFHARLYDHLGRVLQNPGQSFPGVFDGLRTVEVVEKIYSATREA